jgi:hypothetical protein
LLETPESHAHDNVTGNGQRERFKKGMDWTISSQAAKKFVEGSTTRFSSLSKFLYGKQPTSAENYVVFVTC